MLLSVIVRVRIHILQFTSSSFAVRCSHVTYTRGSSLWATVILKLWAVCVRCWSYVCVVDRWCPMWCFGRPNLPASLVYLHFVFHKKYLYITKIFCKIGRTVLKNMKILGICSISHNS